MVRGKIEMKRIENAISRQVTFSKRRGGLLKKAHELSVLCEAQIAVIIFSERGRLSEFASSDMKKILERYKEYVAKDDPTNEVGEDIIQQIMSDTLSMADKTKLLELYQRELMGQGLSSFSYDELQVIENHMETRLHTIRLRKAELYREQIEQLQNKERDLLTENAKLREMCGQNQQCAKHREEEEEVGEAPSHSPSYQSSDAVVDTQLFIGLPIYNN